MFRSKATPRRNIKTGIDADDSRRKREDNALELRKNTREEMMQKRRVPVGAASLEKEPPTPSTNAGDIPALAKGCMSEDPATQIDCTRRLRKLLSIEKNPPIQAVIDIGIVPRLVHFCRANGDATLVFEAAWALTNVASGNSTQTKIVIEQGAIPVFCNLLSSQHAEVKEQAVWALGNIAGDSYQCRDLVLRHGGLPHLMRLCQTQTAPPSVMLLRNITWAMANLCRGKPEPDFNAIRPVLMVMAMFIRMDDPEVLIDTCWALSYISDDPSSGNTKIQSVVDCGVIPRLVELLGHRETRVQTPALRCIGNIVTGTDRQTQTTIEHGVIPRLLGLLSHPKRVVRKEACWSLSNITAGSIEQIEQCISANVLPRMIQVLATDEFNVRKEATWALCNVTNHGKNKHIRYLVDNGLLPPLCEMLNCSDPKIIQVAMEGIENTLKVGETDSASNNGVNPFIDILEQCGGVDSLESLQRHDNEQIYEKAVSILQKFFEIEEDEDVNLAPKAASQNEFSFGATPAMGMQLAKVGPVSQSPFKFQF